MSSPVLWGPNNTANNLQNQELLATGALLAYNGAKNYIGYCNFENQLTTGYSLGTIGTLTNGLPTGTPTFGSGASGNLSLGVTTSSPIEGAASLQYISSAATTQGNMVATQVLNIDAEDQAKVLTVKFYYAIPSGAANANFSGTSSNSFAWAIWDVTNSSWLTSAGNFNFVQNSGCGYVTGTCQTNINTTQIRLVIYNANATTGAATLTLDGLYVGPQTAPSGPAMTDLSNTYSPTIAGMTISSSDFHYQRFGDQLRVIGNASVSAVSSTTASITLPSGLAIDTTKLGSTAKKVGDQTGFFTTATELSGANTWNPLFYDGSTNNLLFFALQSSSGSFVKNAANSVTVASGGVAVDFMVPIVGWSSNTAMSSDTDTRVISMFASASGGQSIGSSASQITNLATSFDTSGAFSSNSFVVPVSGIYTVNANVWYTAATYSGNNGVYLYLYKNGSAQVFLNVSRTASSGTWAPATSGGAAVKCNAGDVLSIWAQSDATNTTSGATFSVSRQSGPAVIAATESVNAKYTFVGSTTLPNSTPETLTSTYAAYTKTKDTHNAFNTSSGVYTIPVSGEYRAVLKFLVVNTSASVGGVYATLAQAGSQSVTSTNVTPFAAISLGATGIISESFNCLAGDTITLSAQQSNGASIAIISNSAYNSFSIERVGN